MVRTKIGRQRRSVAEESGLRVQLGGGLPADSGRRALFQPQYSPVARVLRDERLLPNLRPPRFQL
ncbi:hypothetical protein LINPERHAP1_LOCUS9758 [Linum perenne]